MSEATSEKVYLLNGEPVVLAEFLAQDFDDDLTEGEGIGETRARLLELQPGGVVMIGGGAAPLFEVRCVLASFPAPVEEPLWESPPCIQRAPRRPELGRGNMTGIGQLLAPFTRRARR
jgi:hypothetical protein